MSMRIEPFGRGFHSQRGLVNPFGPHHCSMCAGSFQAFHTRLRGALNTRVITRSHSEDSIAVWVLARGFAAIGLLLFSRFLLFQLTQVIVEPVKTLLPKTAIVLDPSRDILQRSGLQPARTPLCLASARDQPGALQHF